MADERPDGIALILRAIELTIAEVEAAGDSDRDKDLRMLRSLRARWQAKAEAGDG